MQTTQNNYCAYSSLRNPIDSALQLNFLSFQKKMFQRLKGAVENVARKKTSLESGLQNRVDRCKAVLFSYISFG